MGLTPMEQPYPGGADGGHLVVEARAAAPVAGKPRWRITVPAYKDYSYEVYANPTMGGLGWAALPFSMSESAKVDRSIYTATAEGVLDLYVDKPSVKGSYYVAFRVPGANTGTPGDMGFGPGGPPPGGPRGRGGPGGPRGGRGPGDFGPPPGDGGFPPPPDR
jgi:hypothetical protein